MIISLAAGPIGRFFRGDDGMGKSVVAAKSPWSGALVALAAIAVVSVVALVRDWGWDSWIWAAAVCAGGGIASAVTQTRRNRRLDRAGRQARRLDGAAEPEHGLR